MRLIKKLIDWFEDFLWTQAIKDVFENPEYISSLELNTNEEET